MIYLSGAALLIAIIALIGGVLNYKDSLMLLDKVQYLLDVQAVLGDSAAVNGRLRKIEVKLEKVDDLEFAVKMYGAWQSIREGKMVWLSEHSASAATHLGIATECTEVRCSVDTHCRPLLRSSRYATQTIELETDAGAEITRSLNAGEASLFIDDLKRYCHKFHVDFK